MRRFFLYLMLFGGFLASCTVEPAEIEYGFDSCSFCKMIITDPLHASQRVTAKGRVYKYDAIECLINDRSEWQNQDLAYLLVVDYNRPGTFIDAKTATYVISPAIPSPMGENLLAVASESKAKQLLRTVSGQAYTWEEITSEVTK